MSISAETNNGDVTSWIPLTSIFIPSSGCESIFRLNGPSLVAFDPGYGLDIDTQLKCAPSAVTTWWEQARMGNGGNVHTAVSIQPLICPNDWTTVATFTKNTSTTQIMCCPSGYRLAHATPGPVNGDCISNLRSGMELTYACTPKKSPPEWEITTTTMEFSSSAGAIAVVGYNVDCPESTTSHSVTEASTIILPNPTPTLPLPTTTFISSSPDPKNNGLSVGAKIGIGIGSSLGGVGVSALVIAMIIIRKRHKKTIYIPAGVSEGEYKPRDAFQQRGALEVEPIYELPDDARVGRNAL